MKKGVLYLPHIRLQKHTGYLILALPFVYIMNLSPKDHHGYDSYSREVNIVDQLRYEYDTRRGFVKSQQIHDNTKPPIAHLFKYPTKDISPVDTGQSL